MSTFIGLFPCNQEVSHQIRQLEKDGFARDSIHVLNQVGAIRKLLGCETNRVVAQYTGWAASFTNGDGRCRVSEDIFTQSGLYWCEGES
jgi:hypothetical protein